MRRIALGLAAMMLPSAAAGKDARITLAIGEERSLDEVTNGLLSDGETLLALAAIGAPDESLAASGVQSVLAEASPPSLAVSLTQFDMDFWVELVPPGVLAAEPERRPLPQPDEEPCQIGLNCRDKSN